MDLLTFRRNVASQKGEDGILEKILEVLEIETGWCVEFGASDGHRFSNTFNLLNHRNWRGIQIEPNPERFSSLENRYRGREPDIVCINRYVGLLPETGLDAVLAETEVPRDFQLLSIDIDGNDYHVWDDLRNYRSRVVVIEYNPTIPNAVSYVQPRDLAVHHGNALRSLVDLGRAKGYQLVCATGLNAIFVQDEDFPRFEIGDNSIETLNQDQSLVTHMFVCYDGTIKLAGRKHLIWHRVPIAEENVQVLPTDGRGYPPPSPSKGDSV